MSKTNMFIRRTDNGGFTRVPNELVRSGLSPAAFRLLVFALSVPPDWKFSVKGCAALLPMGERSISSALAELKKQGYLATERETDDHGRITGMKYMFSDHPAVSTFPQGGTEQGRNAKMPVRAQDADFHMWTDHMWAEGGCIKKEETKTEKIHRFRRNDSLGQRIAALDEEVW